MRGGGRGGNEQNNDVGGWSGSRLRERVRVWFSGGKDKGVV